MTDRPLDDAAMRRLLDVGREDLPDLDLGKYELIREIGRGGMGIVYEAQDQQLGRRVAVKLLSEHAGFSATLRQRFVREATAAGRLQHPHIAQVFDATPDFIAMQLVAGTPLHETPLETQEIVRLLRDAAFAVQHAHDHGIVHRDLKPSNLLVDGDHVYVMDFGLAKETQVDSTLSMSGHVLGTPGFMAPEQAQGRVRDVDERSDVYGLGATLWATLSGRPPFEGEDVIEVMRRVVDEEPRAIAGVDSDLDTIARTAMAKEPERRYATARAFGEDLQRFLDGQPIEARPPSRWYRLSRFAARHRNVLRVAAAVAVSMILVAAVVLYGEMARHDATRAGLRLSNTVAELLADAEDHRRLSDFDEQGRLLELGVTDCDRFLREFGEVAQAHYLRGKLLRRLASYPDSLAALDRALDLDDSLTEARFERGLLLLEWADAAGVEGGTAAFAVPHYREQARKDLSASLQHAPSLRSVDAEYGRACVATLEEDLDAAVLHLQRVLELDPGHTAALVMLPQLHPDDVELQRQLSARLMDIGRGFFPGATTDPVFGVPPVVQVELTRRGILVDVPTSAGSLPHDVLTYSLRAQQRMFRAERMELQGLSAQVAIELQSALADWDHALEIAGDDGFVPAWHNRGVLRLRRAAMVLEAGDALAAFGQRVLATQDFDRALAAEPNLAFAYVNRALASAAHAEQQERGGQRGPAATNRAAAFADCSRALELLPKSWSQRSRLEELRDTLR